MVEVANENLNSLRYLFNDIRFYMGNSVLDGNMGRALVDNVNTPTFAILLVRSYCFISGMISEKDLKNIIDIYDLENYIIIPSDEIKTLLEKIYSGNIEKFQRYSIKKNVKFNKEQLIKYVNNSNKKFQFLRINDELSERIRAEGFIHITDDYKNNGIGYCCMNDKDIIGVASSNIFYNDGIEVNIKVKEEYRRKGIATTLAAMLILSCLEENKKVSWDAANLNSVYLAEKLGFEFASEYDCYRLV